MRRCINCKNWIRDDPCPHCGYSEPQARCGKCGHLSSSLRKICPTCGNMKQQTGKVNNE